MKSFLCTVRFLMVFLLVVAVASCDRDDEIELITTDTSNRLSVEQVSLLQLEEHPDLAGLFSNTSSKTDVHKGVSGNPEKDASDYTILTGRISKAAFKDYEAYTFLIDNPGQPPFSFDNYVIRKHHDGMVEEFILRYSYDMHLWHSEGRKKFSSITRYDTQYTPIGSHVSKNTAQKPDCDVYVTVYHETPDDGIYEWEPGAVCYHNTPGDMCNIIIEYTLDCSGGGGGETPEDDPEGGPGGTDPGAGDPGEGGEMLPDNGGPGTPIATMEPPLGPEAGAGDLFYLRQLIEEDVTPATTEEELLNKNNALAVYLNELNPFIFNDLSLLLVSVNAESELSLDDRVFLWEKAKTIYDILKTKENTVPYHITSEDFLNSLTLGEQQSFTENIATTALLPAVKSVMGIQWPQNTGEWIAVFNLIKPMLIEIGIEFLPLGGLYNAINDMADGLSEGDYTLAAVGLAGVLMEFIPWGKLIKIGKALFGVGKKAFKIFKLAYNFLGQIGDAIAQGLKTVLDGNTVRLVNEVGDEVASITNNFLHVSKHGIKAADGSVVFRSADEVNSELLALGYTNPPYDPNSAVTEFITAEPEQFVRVFNPMINDANGKWLVKYSEIEGLSAEAIKNKLSLPHLPTKIVDVNVPHSIGIRTGKTSEITEYGTSGSGIQFELLEVIDDSNFINSRDL